jgi:hypothetical protein
MALQKGMSQWSDCSRVGPVVKNFRDEPDGQMGWKFRWFKRFRNALCELERLEGLVRKEAVRLGKEMVMLDVKEMLI